MESRCIVNKIWKVVEMFLACFGVHVALGTTTTVDTCPAPHIVDTSACHVPGMDPAGHRFILNHISKRVKLNTAVALFSASYEMMLTQFGQVCSRPMHT